MVNHGVLDHESLMKEAMLCTKACNSLLAVTSNDFEYYLSFPSFREGLSQCATRCLSMVETAMVAQAPNAPRPNLAQTGDIDEIFDTIVDFSDRQMERVDGFIEDIAGSASNLELVHQSPFSVFRRRN